jgi:hypothetical protein
VLERADRQSLAKWGHAAGVASRAGARAVLVVGLAALAIFLAATQPIPAKSVLGAVALVAPALAMVRQLADLASHAGPTARA